MNDPAVWDNITSKLDVKSLVDYVLVNSITVCSDWLNYNTGWWRGLDSSGTHKKWGYILWDNDATFGFMVMVVFIGVEIFNRVEQTFMDTV